MLRKNVSGSTHYIIEKRLHRCRQSVSIYFESTEDTFYGDVTTSTYSLIFYKLWITALFWVINLIFFQNTEFYTSHAHIYYYSNIRYSMTCMRIGNIDQFFIWQKQAIILYFKILKFDFKSSLSYLNFSWIAMKNKFFRIYVFKLNITFH